MIVFMKAPQLNLQQIEAAIAKGGQGAGYDQEMINDLMAQTYAASVRWPKDKVNKDRCQNQERISSFFKIIVYSDF